MLLPILAQYTPVPVSPQTVPLMPYVTQALNALVAPTSNVFLGNAQTLLNKVGLLALVLGALTWTWDYLTGNHIFSGEAYWRVMIRFLIAYNLLHYYNSPLPLVGYSFHQIFTEESRFLSDQIDIHILNTLLQNLQQLWGQTEKPHVYDVPATVIYMFVGGLMGLLEMAMFVVTGFAFWALAVGIMLGPFFIVAYLFRGTAHYFWAWVNFMVKYSLYRVVASAVVAVFSNVILNFIGTTVAGDYSIGHWWAIALSWAAICAIGIIACVKVGSLVNDLTTGGAYAGSYSSVPFAGRLASKFF